MSTDGPRQVRMAVDQVPAEGGPKHEDGRPPTAGSGLARVLRLWHTYGIHTLLATLMAVPTYILLDRARLEDEISRLRGEAAALQEVLDRVTSERNDWRRNSERWQDRLWLFEKQIQFQGHTQPFSGVGSQNRPPR